MCKCTGCGVNLQTHNKDLIGYTVNIDKSLCERCFRIRNYNEYKTVVKDNQDYINILNDIGKTNDLVVLVVDLFNINKNLSTLSKYINNNILLVLTKRDILPKSCYDEKLKNYFDKYNLNIIDKVIISSLKNYNFDELYNKIIKYKNSNNVYVVGYTNSGKSSMINKIIYNYSSNDINITTSNLPSTTIDSIKVIVNDDLTLIDTPGLLDNGDIINYIDEKMLKKVIATKEIKPITYQIKEKQYIMIEDLVKLDFNNKNNITIYISNKLNINRFYKDKKINNDYIKHEFNVYKDSDIVIQGLCFIKCSESSSVTVYTKKGVNVFLRDNLI